MLTDRFAPSPTGELHLGHAFSACVGWSHARAGGGRYLLRMEDLDEGRVRARFVDDILRDLRWLGIDWDGEVLFQSTRIPAHLAALEHLGAQGLTYRCTCSRRDILEAASAPQEGASAPHGPDGLVYPGTCRAQPVSDSPAAIRLNMARAVEWLGGADVVARIGFTETGAGPDGESGRIALDARALIEGTGDIVLRRRDGAPAYHLAVVVDDAFQEVTRVTRGRDLFVATPVQRLLQALLGLPEVEYHHHRLIRDESGRRLAKRDRDLSLSALRAAGATPEEVLRGLGLRA
ncbi:tRNA glutamyl-Q(34) synthetase GluQRS [Limibaculum sp. M0105]|uniref:tRNA glutamyl-Q(34) synthetase GluQRS n=1 Tax=Thermohalobaculum xanthum TaxID=2753746 RepID=A0A8J7S9Z1_9RHOB|nr:tRNA glutamyl-Q(34) synthetase GluQRS [Thermohalobaculum xanthum]MBK0397997.1 tRNA glutamyl-Q(34) synthetase GluQRS [Thermohalobaculum xanthum]